MKLLLLTFSFLISSSLLYGQALGLSAGYVQYSTEQVPEAMGSTMEAYVAFDSITPSSEIIIAVGFSRLQGYSDWLQSNVNIGARRVQLAWQRIIPLKSRLQLLAGVSLNYMGTSFCYTRDGIAFTNQGYHSGPGLYGGLRYGNTADLPLGIELTVGPVIFVTEEWDDQIPYCLNIQLGITYSLYKKRNHTLE
ncbi:MAG TPA: hypothetical protein DIU20_05070 [Cryomorphaceae bacterium]|nr:hypothetical protein [Cryomorphaceae bacterium]